MKFPFTPGSFTLWGPVPPPPDSSAGPAEVNDGADPASVFSESLTASRYSIAQAVALEQAMGSF